MDAGAELSELSDLSYRHVLEEARDSVKPGLDQLHATMLDVARGAPGRLSDNLHELLARRGKRIRATFLLLLASSQGSGQEGRAVRAAASVELIHLASLVHDDIIDDSDLRRNEKTAHQRWGNRQAVLLGDYILAKAMEMIWSDPDHRIPLGLSRASGRLIAGEVMEIEQAGRAGLGVPQYLSIIEAKTASLLEACGECGAILAGFGAERVRACAELGKRFGIAFQIVDDLLDFGYGAQDLDKRTFSDLKNGLSTLPLILYYERAGAEAQREMQAWLANPADAGNQERIRAALEREGAFTRARDLALGQIERCLGIVADLPDGEATGHLRRLCRLMAERSA